MFEQFLGNLFDVCGELFVTAVFEFQGKGNALFPFDQVNADQGSGGDFGITFQAVEKGFCESFLAAQAEAAVGFYALQGFHVQ